MKQLKRLWIWCRRIGHLNGFGVQSPFAFSFVHSVIYRKLSRDIRRRLQTCRKSSPYKISRPLPGRVERLLYKLAVHVNPAYVIYIEKEFTGGVYSLLSDAACMCTVLVEKPPVMSGMSRQSGSDCVHLLAGDLEKHLEEKLSTHASVDLIYIDLMVSHAEDLCERLMARCRRDSVLVAGSIHATAAAFQLWRQLTERPETALSFDLYSVGILLFDHHYHKHSYLINFEL